jgi:hypothetical protein
MSWGMLRVVCGARSESSMARVGEWRRTNGEWRMGCGGRLVEGRDGPAGWRDWGAEGVWGGKQKQETKDKANGVLVSKIGNPPTDSTLTLRKLVPINTCGNVHNTRIYKYTNVPVAIHFHDDSRRPELNSTSVFRLGTRSHTLRLFVYCLHSIPAAHRHPRLTRANFSRSQLL